METPCKHVEACQILMGNLWHQTSLLFISINSPWPSQESPLFCLVKIHLSFLVPTVMNRWHFSECKYKKHFFYHISSLLYYSEEYPLAICSHLVILLYLILKLFSLSTTIHEKAIGRDIMVFRAYTYTDPKNHYGHLLFFIVGTKMPLKIGLLRHYRPPPSASLRWAKNKSENADDSFACKLVSRAQSYSTCVYDFLFPCTNLGVCAWTQ